jgi:hypothetical protein
MLASAWVITWARISSAFRSRSALREAVMTTRIHPSQFPMRHGGAEHSEDARFRERRFARTWPVIGPVLVCLMMAAGCQCAPLTDPYLDAVDYLADRELELDALYHPAFDLTRIGRPEWCCCRMNWRWCRRGCTHRPPVVPPPPPIVVPHPPVHAPLHADRHDRP